MLLPDQMVFQPGKHLEMVALLYHEAKENVIDGRYTVKGLKNYETNQNIDCWYDQLAGLQAFIEEGTLHYHDTESYR